MQLRLSALLVLPDQIKIDDILSGNVTIIVTERCYDFKAGKPLILFNHLEGWVIMVDMVEVAHRLFSEITSEECQAAGFTKRLDFLDSLNISKRNLSLSSKITILKWANTRGRLVDTHRENHKFRESLNLMSKE